MVTKQPFLPSNNKSLRRFLVHAPGGKPSINHLILHGLDQAAPLQEPHQSVRI